MIDFKGQNVLVLGAGTSGVAAAKLLIKLGAKVTIFDEKSQGELSQAQEALRGSKVLWNVMGDAPLELNTFSALVTSPGVPLTHFLIKKANTLKLPVIGELELGWRNQNLAISAVTGSNGKTTVASLTDHILSKQNYRNFLGGNIGNPFCNCALELMEKKEAYQTAVLEVSSFQLETVSHFHAKGAAFLNLSFDHLDRHGDMEQYLRLKNRIFINQSPEDMAIINLDAHTLYGELKARTFGFSRKKRPDFGAYVNNSTGSELIQVVEGDRVLAEGNFKDYLMFGTHNQENLMAAVGLAMSLGVNPQAALLAAKDFSVAGHRLQLVGSYKGVSYYDDSKATNVGAVVVALENFGAKSVILIAGGRDKDMDFRPLIEPVKEKVRWLVLIGEAKEKLQGLLAGAAPMTLASGMKEAVSVASSFARPGDTVLLSPACASFDQFSSYKQRGEVFQKEVKRQNGEL